MSEKLLENFFSTFNTIINIWIRLKNIYFIKLYVYSSITISFYFDLKKKDFLKLTLLTSK